MNSREGGSDGGESFCVLGIDQSTKASGWCLDVPGKDPEVGLAKTAADRRVAVYSAYNRARSYGMSVVAVLEDHRSFGFSRGNMSVKSLLGMGAARGAWTQELECAGVRDVHLVTPLDWRKLVLGLKGNVSGETAKQAAQLYAFSVLGVATGSDEAEALCLAKYGRDFLRPKPRRRGKV